MEWRELPRKRKPKKPSTGTITGIVFKTKMELYLAMSTTPNPDGNPQYYMDLIFKAAKRVGVDLNIYGAGLKDGVENTQK